MESETNIRQVQGWQADATCILQDKDANLEVMRNSLACILGTHRIPPLLIFKARDGHWEQLNEEQDTCMHES